MRVTIAFRAAIPCLLACTVATGTHAQTQAAFEVVSVKRVAPKVRYDPLERGIRITTPGRATMAFQRVRDLMASSCVVERSSRGAFGLVACRWTGWPCNSALGLAVSC